MGNSILYLIPAFGVLALLYTVWKSAWTNKQDAGNHNNADDNQPLAQTEFHEIP